MLSMIKSNYSSLRSLEGIRGQYSSRNVSEVAFLHHKAYNLLTIWSHEHFAGNLHRLKILILELLALAFTS